MKKIIRTRTITKTSRRLVVCHENFAASETGESVPAVCPNCGERILPQFASTPPPPELTGGPSDETETL